MGGAAIKFAIWAALLALLVLTVALTFAPLGPWRLVASLGIAAAKAALIYWFYMDLRSADGIERLAALIGVLFLLILLVLGGLDFAVRNHTISLG